MSSEVILSVDNVSKRFGGTKAASNLSLELHAGEVLALAGDNGAGKSTLIKMIAGVHQPDQGEIRFSGETITNRTPHEVRDLGIETIYQDLALADNLDVGINIFLGRERMKRVLGLPVLDRKLMRKEAQSALKHLGIELNDLSMPVRYLSGGQRQAIAISRAVYWQAKIIIMQEPLAAMFARWSYCAVMVPEHRAVRLRTQVFFPLPSEALDSPGLLRLLKWV